MDVKNSMISKEKFDQGMTYDEYFKYVESEAQAPSTEVNQKYQSYIKQNIARMKRLGRKEVVLDESELSETDRNMKLNIVVLSEAWCGDASQILPIAINIFENLPKSEVRVFLRDQQDELMNHFLTNNTKSIPIIALFDEDFSFLDFWGPRSTEAQEVYQQLRKQELPMDDLLYHLHKWYSDDKGATTIAEIKQMLVSSLTACAKS